MTTTISNGTITRTALRVESFATARAANNVVHRIIGTNVPAVVFREAALRSGTIRAAVATRAEAEAMSDLLAGAYSLTLTDSDVPELSMQYVTTDTIEIDRDSVGLFWVSSGFQEVTP